LRLNDEGFLEYSIKTPNDAAVTNIMTNRKSLPICTCLCFTFQIIVCSTWFCYAFCI